MTRRKSQFVAIAALCCATAFATPDGGERLAPCPASPNCVSSEAGDAGHRIAALQLAQPAAAAWRTARRVVAAMPRTRIVSETDTALHAECSSAVFGFVDDLELRLRPAQGVIAVRSASRTGWSDFGVNRRRVEALREALIREAAAR